MNSLSYHESHSHGSLGLPFQAYSQEDPYGQYFVPYHWHDGQVLAEIPYRSKSI